jgi:hypothetical protein
MDDVNSQLAQVLRDRRAIGKYRGIVSDNDDPDLRGRLKVSVPALLGDQDTDWALPCFPCGGTGAAGWFAVPPVGAQVWVEFEGGDLSYPIWTGTFWPEASDVPAEVQGATSQLMKTPGGHAFVMEDKDNEEQLSLTHSGGASIVIDHDGSVVVTDQNNGKVTLDAKNGQLLVEDANGNSIKMTSTGTTVADGNGNKIEMAASGINVKGAQIVVDGDMVMLGGSGGEPLIKGQSFLTLFATHVHTCGAPGGPTSPAIPQGEMSSLSTKVMAS